MLLSLYRTNATDEATCGTLIVGGELLYTIEQPFRDNQQGHSCVPEGSYELIPYMSPKHGPTWQLHNPACNVWGRGPAPAGVRTFCEIHSANWAEQLEGCIALGLDDQPSFDPLTGRVEPAVEHSRDAVAHLLAFLGEMSPGHTLSIRRAQ